jgi:hypothetical protein
MDLNDLRREVNAVSLETAFDYLARANAKEYIEKEKAKELQATEKKKKGNKPSSSQADHISQMTPDQLRAQARLMRSLPPHQLRRSHPQLRHMSDAEIEQAATQMEQMADNPEMVRMAAEQVKNMSPEELERAKQQKRGHQRGSRSRNAATTSPANALENMSLEQLTQQVKVMKTMTKDQIRQMNPQMTTMTDQQIEEMIGQMEQLVNDPVLFETTKNQMKGMTPEDIAKLQAGGDGGGKLPQGTDLASMLENMDGKQVKQMMKMLKENPSMVKQMGPQGEQAMKMLQMFDGMDEAQLDSTLKMMRGVQKATAPFRNAYATVNGFCGGHLVKVVLFLGLLYLGIFVYLRFFVAGGENAVPNTLETVMQEDPKLIPVSDDIPVIVDSEF